MMRIHSLKALPSIKRPVTVIVNSSCFGVDLTSFESRSTFFRSVPESLPDETPLIVVNPTPVIVERLHEKRVFHSERHIELWADATGFSDLAQCVSEFDALAVSGTLSDHEWFKIGVRGSTATDRPGQDFLVGLQAVSLVEVAITEACSVAPGIPYQDSAGVNPKSSVLQIATRIAKPIKPFLPAPVIHFLYKILGVLR